MELISVETVQNIVGVVVATVLMVVLIIKIQKRKAKAAKENAEKKQEELHKKKIRATQMRIIHQRQQDGIGELIDYADYHMNLKEWIVAVIGAGLVFSILGYIFYEKPVIILLMSLFGLFFPIQRRKQLLVTRKHVLNLQFKEAVQSLSASLAAGRSAESSFQEVAYDLKLLYPDPNTYILKEFDIINRRVENGEPLERAIEDFAQRSDVEDIMNFADVFVTCKRTGGSLVEVMKRTADIISDKLEVQQDMKVLVSQKKFEAQILNLMPVGMVLLLKLTGGDYLNPLYDWNGPGPVIMTVCLLFLLAAYLIGQKIMNIKM
ncbi:type II secretion system F family protein [Carnobacterium gallinarum]|uniref:type II secretion system F family protein n=1 Tax=Carnobacterium gallinarum TaxID=2749 RepID=UPI0005548E90|nr:type II secretion system F family protein [Carnobacterium gallinarum]